MSVTPRKTRSQGPADEVDLDHSNGTHTPAKSGWFDVETEVSWVWLVTDHPRPPSPNSLLHLSHSLILSRLLKELLVIGSRETALTSSPSARLLQLLPLHPRKQDHPLHLHPSHRLVGTPSQHQFTSAHFDNDFTPRSTLILAAHVHLPGAKAITLFPGFAFQPSLALLLAVGYQIYYLLLEPLGGVRPPPLPYLKPPTDEIWRPSCPSSPSRSCFTPPRPTCSPTLPHGSPSDPQASHSG